MWGSPSAAGRAECLGNIDYEMKVLVSNMLIGYSISEVPTRGGNLHKLRTKCSLIARVNLV